MDKVFVVKNQQGLYLSKQQEWISGADQQALYRTPHRDEAVNTVFEVSSRDIYLRAEAVACALDAKNNPVVDIAGQEQLAIDDGTGEPASAEAAAGDARPDAEAAETPAGDDGEPA